MSTSVRLNALVVGSGWAGHGARAFAARRDVCVRGVVARGSERSFALARALDVPIFVSMAEAIQETQPSLAIVAVGDETNPALATELLRAGAHVLCAHPVAPSASQVADLARIAFESGRIVSADYSMRTTEAFEAARIAMRDLGELLRVEITYPGRFLPMAIDLALAFAGHVDAVSAFGRYPDSLSERRAKAPAAFPPTLVLEHRLGAVTTLTPSPHAVPTAALRITASHTAGRIDVELPAGGARRVRNLAGGAFEETILLPPNATMDAKLAFAEAMHAMANAFVDAVVAKSPPPSPLEDEAEVRRVWSCIGGALRARMPITIERP